MNNLESVLEQELRPVSAPAELWERIERPRPRRAERRRSEWRWAVAMAAVILVVSAPWALRRDNALQSADPAQIRAWVMANAGIDVPLSLAAPVQMASVGSIDRGRGAEIAYEIDGQHAILRVTPADADQPVQHSQVINGSRSAKWILRGQVYTLECASPEGLQTACRLCHG